MVKLMWLMNDIDIYDHISMLCKWYDISLW